MGKKKQKRKESCSSSVSSLQQHESFSTDDSLYKSNSLLKEGDVIPEKLMVSSVEASGVGSYCKCLNSDFKNVVFLHPSVMRRHNIEDLVLIKGEDRMILCTAYPLKVLKKSLLVFPKNYCFKYKELVTLLHYEHNVRPAREILIHSEERNIDQNMLKFILRQLCDQYIYVGMPIQWNFFDKPYQCIIKNIICLPDISYLSLKETMDNSAPQFYSVSCNTVLKVKSEMPEPHDKMSAFKNIGGMEKEIILIKKYIHMFLNSTTFHSSVFCTLMLYGPSGIGKSLILDAICKEYNIFTEKILWYSIYSKSQSEAKKELETIFQKAVDKAPSIIIIDEFNHLCPGKSKAENFHYRYISKILSQLIQRLDDARVMFIAATNDSEYDDSVLQTSRRLVEIMKLQISTSQEREDVFNKLLNATQNNLTSEEVAECAKLAHGFSGRDLFIAIRDAKFDYFMRNYSSEVFNKTEEYAVFVEFSSLKRAIKQKKVAAGNIKVKEVKWTDIGGMRESKEKLKQLVEWPLKYPDKFKKFNVTPCRGILMYGPPGCSKTMIAKALATECELNFISKNASDIFDKYVGESEKAVRDLFAMAKAKSPCIIFLDEIDAFVAERGSSSGGSGVDNRIVTSFLTEMDGIEELHGVIVIAATNRPDILDDALIRNGRINYFIHVPLPDVKAREEILRINMRNRLVSEEFDYSYLSLKTEGYTGAEIVNLCNEAALELLSEDPEAQCLAFQLKHFEKALEYSFPRTSKEMLKFYESFNEKYC